MKIPFTPRSIPEHRRRYPLAVAEVFDVEAAMLGTGMRPGECEANVFDSVDGLRLCISRDRLPDGEIVLHLSASAVEDSRLYRLIADRQIGVKGFCNLTLSRFRVIAPKAKLPDLIGFSEGKGVPHFYASEG